MNGRRFVSVRIMPLAIPLFIFIGLIVILLFALKRDPHQLPSTFIHKSVPVFEGRLLFHPDQSFSSKSLVGHVTVLHVFASWCVSCQGEHPVLMDIARHFKHVLDIDGLNYKDHRAQVIQWLKSYGNPYHQVIDDPTGRIAMRLGVYGTPETFVIDRQGRIQAKLVGPIDVTRWHQQLLPVIVKLLVKS